MTTRRLFEVGGVGGLRGSLEVLQEVVEREDTGVLVGLGRGGVCGQEVEAARREVRFDLLPAIAKALFSLGGAERLVGVEEGYYAEKTRRRQRSVVQREERVRVGWYGRDEARVREGVRESLENARRAVVLARWILEDAQDLCDVTLGRPLAVG